MADTLESCQCGQKPFSIKTPAGYKIVCKCGHTIKGFYPTEQEAIDVWNNQKNREVELKRKPLKKCYFCEKEKAEVVHFGLVDRFFVRCSNCGACGPLKHTDFEAIEAWNKDGFYSRDGE